MMIKMAREGVKNLLTSWVMAGRERNEFRDPFCAGFQGLAQWSFSQTKALVSSAAGCQLIIQKP
jgi:hypothetical protein